MCCMQRPGFLLRAKNQHSRLFKDSIYDFREPSKYHKARLHKYGLNMHIPQFCHGKLNFEHRYN